jgi:hypothetical protein
MDEKNDGLTKNWLSKGNTYMGHLLKYQQWYLYGLVIAVLLIPILQNLIAGNPLIWGAESYYHLLQAQTGGLQNLHLYPLARAMEVLPDNILILIPFLRAIFAIFLFQIVAKRLKMSDRFRFLFLAFLIVTPAFIYTFSTLSGTGFFIPMVLFGFFFLTMKQKIVQYISVIPFILATFVDLFSTIFLLILLIMFIIKKSGKSAAGYTAAGVSVIALLTHWIIFKQPFFLGPFHAESIFPNLVSDLGGVSGISFFLLLLTVVGISVTWKRKNFYFAYIFLPLIVVAYAFTSHVIFLASLLAIFFATIGFIKLFEQRWQLKTIKKFTLFLLLLGLFFSTLSYLDRIDHHSPTGAEVEGLRWMEGVTDKDFVLSAPENSYYIQYFGMRKPFYAVSEQHQTLYDIPALQATYVTELFPFLEKHEISVIYLSESMTENLPEDIGFRFLLKNERFKLGYSQEGVEVWTFT